MWKISRNIIFPRWNPHQCKFNDSNFKKTTGIQILVAAAPPNEKKRSHEQNDWKKEHFSQRFWNSAQFLLSKSLLLETAGWLGTVSVLCFHLHHKHFYSMFDYEHIKNHCIFSKSVKALPENSHKDNKYSENLIPEKHLETSYTTEDLRSVGTIPESFQGVLQDLRTRSIPYAAAVHNSRGISYLESSDKKAFRSFKRAANLGSSQGLYNLGICYELGIGTKVNLTRAAFCYRKAAMKGHGSASFNLAVYFRKGIGGLPVDFKIAKLLIEQAAAKNVPEAQLYLGLEYLEEEKWSDAYNVFSNLASKDNTDGKYYLGLCYENGWGIDKDEKVAVEFFSQNATLGHTKSIRSLIKYYEEGLGGCKSNLDFALALSQILVDQGDEEGKKALLRLTTKKISSKIAAKFKKIIPNLDTKRNRLHISSSFPELTLVKTTKPKSSSPAVIPSYLDLITNFSSVKMHRLDERKNPTIFIDEDKLNVTFITSYIHPVKLNVLPMLITKM
ncbi:death ligand signal enhancer [Nephila pilipes]|uniref:Death ligand signal enhancer n=1 Tax=Nephila pilipes TaxID=299642 RepID=A0A8X6NNN6_NEPPI|nr:death ligand signal enhancer [Nephila pilipes]